MRDEPTLYAKVYLQRLDGVDLSASNVVYVEKNGAGEIEKMILKDVTGDMYTYAVTSKVKTSKDADGKIDVRAYQYTFDSNGTTYTDSGRSLPVIGRRGRKAVLSGQTVDNVKSMNAITGNVRELTSSSITVGNTKYALASDVIVYTMTYDNSGYKYLITPIDTVAEKSFQATRAFRFMPTRQRRKAEELNYCRKKCDVCKNNKKTVHIAFDLHGLFVQKIFSENVIFAINSLIWLYYTLFSIDIIAV
ncbi:MAG: hypothetical protein L6V93_13510 [Clostridiales bacterium]|nr:MAG: hypothetical protein L6V93_13510 [Clostridiales bacterium]